MARAARCVIEQHGWSAGSDLEDRAALRLHAAGFTPRDVAQQHRVGPYRLDFAWLRLKLALEVDGPWHMNPAAARRDAERDSYLRAEGWVVLRVDDAVADPVRFAAQVDRVAEIAQRMIVPRQERTPAEDRAITAHRAMALGDRL